jgi:hypothetical protein
MINRYIIPSIVALLAWTLTTVYNQSVDIAVIKTKMEKNERDKRIQDRMIKRALTDWEVWKRERFPKR